MRTDTIFVRRVPAPLGAPRPDCLIAADDESAARLAKIGLADVAEVRIVRARSLPQMRLYRAAVKKIAEAIGEPPDRLHNWTKLRLGFYDLMEVRRGSGKAVPVLESTAFNSMPHDRFCQYFQQAKDLWFGEIVPRAESEALLAEIEMLLDGPAPVEHPTAHPVAPPDGRPAVDPAADAPSAPRGGLFPADGGARTPAGREQADIAENPFLLP